jgi:hypothetical protein
MYEMSLFPDSMQYFIYNTIGPNDLLHLSPVPQFKTFQVFLNYCPKCSNFSTIQRYVPNAEFYQFLPLLVKRFFLSNDAFVMAILNLISCVHTVMTPKWLKYSTFSVCNLS